METSCSSNLVYHKVLINSVQIIKTEDVTQSFSVVPTTGDLLSLDICVQQHENNAKWLPKTRHRHPYHLTSAILVQMSKPKKYELSIWIVINKQVPEVTCQQNFAKTKRIVAGLSNSVVKGCYRSKHVNVILGFGHVKIKSTVLLPRVVTRLKKSSVL